jgi:hypothetical protein
MLPGRAGLIAGYRFALIGVDTYTFLCPVNELELII